MGVSFSPLFSIPLDVSSNVDFVKGKIGWSLGLNNILTLSKKSNIFLLTEIGYLNNQLIIEDIPNTSNLIDSQGNINFENLTNYNLIEKYHYLYLSTSLGKTILKLSGNTYLLGSAGFRLNYLYRSTHSSEGFIQNGVTDDFSLIFSNADIEQNLTTSIIASAGIIHKLSDNFSIIITPKFAYELNKIVLKQVPTNQERRFISGGVYLSVLHNFLIF